MLPGAWVKHLADRSMLPSISEGKAVVLIGCGKLGTASWRGRLTITD
jgi:hypothetical protein